MIKLILPSLQFTCLHKGKDKYKFAFLHHTSYLQFQLLHIQLALCRTTISSKLLEINVYINHRYEIMRTTTFKRNKPKLGVISRNNYCRASYRGLEIKNNNKK